MIRHLKTSLIAFVSGIAGAAFFLTVVYNPSHQSNLLALNDELVNPYLQASENRPAKELLAGAEDFVEASAASTQSVVYIRTISEAQYGRTSMLDWFFGGGSSGQRVNSGSGVIYSNDGYIITNNHVIEDASRLEIIHNKRTYEATVVGTDPSTDLAVLKVEAKLPAIKLGSSKDLQVGEWVLAVGNPFNLTSTVTAGIVSAKGRELNIVRDRFPIESFIQTDAAINPGNSGGALVNRRGELVGINTAILSRTGSHAGYGFAVPVDIMRKVANDIIEYGEVQKAFLGADVIDLDMKTAKELKFESLDGVVISYIQTKGAAEKAGLDKSDVIVRINGERITSKSDFEEQISLRSPGDQVNVSFIRDGKEKSSSLTLTNKEGTTDIIRRVSYYSKTLEVEFEKVPKIERDLLKINSGVRVAKVGNGFFRRLGIPEGFIITSINNQKTHEPEEVAEIIERIRGKVIIEGINSRGVKGYYSFNF
jgi:serine protease Do